MRWFSNNISGNIFKCLFFAAVLILIAMKFERKEPGYGHIISSQYIKSERESYFKIAQAAKHENSNGYLFAGCGGFF